MIKCLGMAGLGQDNYQAIGTLPNSEAMNPQALADALSSSQSAGKLVIASAATVTGTDFDDLVEIKRLCEKHDAWLHVDAAFGIFERLVAGPQGKTQGLEQADSITLDCHKWLNVPYECGVFLTRHRQALYDSCHVNAPYLKTNNADINDPSSHIDFMSLGIENSRRFRALPTWLSILVYGRQGLTEQISQNISLAQSLSHWLNSEPDYELIRPCELNVVLFRPRVSGLSIEQATHVTAKCLQAINHDGRLFMTPGVWQGQSIIRAALSNWKTNENDIEIAKQALSDPNLKAQWQSLGK